MAENALAQNGSIGLRPRSLLEIERHLLVYAKPLHKLALSKIRRADIAICIDAITKNSGAVTGNRVRTSISGLFSWSMAKGLCDFNATIGTLRNDEHSRDRVLEPAELRLIWNNLGSNHDHYSAVVRLLMLTAGRASEIASLRWSEVYDNTIVLPTERVKNSRSRIIPLSRPARSIIDAQPRRINRDGTPRDWIFGFAQGGFSGWAIRKNKLNEQIEKATGKPLADWRPHDLRRSAATYLAGGLPKHQKEKLSTRRDKDLAEGLGQPPHVIEAVLGHIGHQAGVLGVYDRSDYLREKAHALDLWAERLMTIVEGRESNVETLQRG
jgi:integrase